MLGEGGQFALPDGEWFCTACTSDAETPLGQGHNDDDEEVGEEEKAGGGENGENDDDAVVEDTKQDHVSPAHEAVVGSPPAASPHRTGAATLLASVKADYHQVRRERNRLLAQWQQERRVQDSLERARRADEQRRDEELIEARRVAATLESRLADSASENRRMHRLFDMLMKEMRSTAPTGSFSSGQVSETAQQGGLQQLLLLPLLRDGADLDLDSLMALADDAGEALRGSTSAVTVSGTRANEGEAQGEALSAKEQRNARLLKKLRSRQASSLTSPTTASATGGSEAADGGREGEGKHAASGAGLEQGQEKPPEAATAVGIPKPWGPSSCTAPTAGPGSSSSSSKATMSAKELANALTNKYQFGAKKGQSPVKDQAQPSDPEGDGSIVTDADIHNDGPTESRGRGKGKCVSSSRGGVAAAFEARHDGAGHAVAVPELAGTGEGGKEGGEVLASISGVSIDTSSRSSGRNREGGGGGGGNRSENGARWGEGRKGKEGNGDHSCTSGGSGGSNREPSKYIDPLRNRLQDLLRTVAGGGWVLR